MLVMTAARSARPLVFLMTWLFFGCGQKGPLTLTEPDAGILAGEPAPGTPEEASEEGSEEGSAQSAEQN